MTNKVVGTVIGKGGEKVKRVREESGCHITFSDNHPGVVERVLTITGEVANVNEACRHVVTQLEHDAAAGAHGQHVQEQTQGPIGENKLTVKVLVPSSQAGAIIGKGGSQLDSMRKSTDCGMQVSQEVLGRSTDRPLTLTGTAAGIIACLALVAQVLHTTPLRAGEQPYIPQQIQQQYGAYGQQQMYGGYGGMYAPKAQQTMQQFTIANDLVGCVIGRGGCEINSMRQQSGAQIRIHDQDNTSTERLVSVSGTPEQVQLAQQLLTIKLQQEVAKAQPQWNQTQ